MVTEDNSFGTNEFMELCKLIGCEPDIAGNVGSESVQEMSAWIEYLNATGESSVTDLRKATGHETPWKIKFWGVENESWGCGGTMTAQYYSNLYRRYASFCKDYSGAPLWKIASGPSGDDTSWMRPLLENIPAGMLWGISLHYYTVPTGDWSHKGSATHFDEAEYFGTLERALQMKNIIEDQEAVMNRYDKNKKIALVVDEWGVWTDAEPHTNPAFLYQQNSLRDALVAASTLNIFNNHSDRVKMAELAQTVNVLQSLILTKGKQIVLTPTYDVFDLYQVYQNAHFLPIKLTAPKYSFNGQEIEAVNASASLDSSGTIHISLVNLDPSKTIALQAHLKGATRNKATGEILTSAHFDDFNSFEAPQKVSLKQFNDFKSQGTTITINLPPKSVIMLSIK